MLDAWPITLDRLSVEELSAELLTAMRRGGRLSREADLHLATVSADHLADCLIAAGLLVYRRPEPGGWA